MRFEALRKATKDDVAWIVAQEQRLDFSSFIHYWSAEAHERNLGDRDKLYLIATDSSQEPVAFVILAGLLSPARSIELVRMAVAQPGIGIGKPLLRTLIHIIFTDLGANRLWLDVFDDNDRARHAYGAVGFHVEGVLRQAVLKRDGTLGSLVVMSILATEFRAGLSS